MGMRRWLGVRLVLSMLLVAAGLVTVLLTVRQPVRGATTLASQTVVLRQGLAGYTGCTDTRISEENPNKNFGELELVLGMKGRISTLIRFDVSSLPANAQIEDARLSIAVVNYGQRGSEPVIIGAFPVTRTWEETQATWYKATNLDFWGLPGCNSTTNDRSPAPLDNQPVYNVGWYTWTVTSAVQTWVQNPAANQGVMLRQTNVAIGGEYDVRQSEYPGLEMRPVLVVTYSLATPTATPSGSSTPMVLPCLGTPEPGATLVVLQNGADYNGAADTFLSFDQRDTRYADTWYVHVGYRRKDSGLLRFDLSGIPQGSRVICAALSLFAERWGGGGLDIGAYDVKRENVVSEATWTWATALAPWQVGGCNGPDDRVQLPDSVVTVSGILNRYQWDLTRVVDDWVNDRLPNYGVSLQAMDEWDMDTIWFTSSEDGTVANRPMLAVLYVPPGSPLPTRTRTPTPTTTCTSAPTATPTATVTRTPTRTTTPGRTRTLTLQNGVDGYAGCHDSRISAEVPFANFSTSDLKVGAQQRLASGIAFDLSQIPTNATVSSADLSLYAYGREGAGNLGLNLYAIKRAWNEEQVTWDRATSAERWGLPGCNHTTSDREGVASASVTAAGTGWYTWSVRADVQSMVAQPATNRGWLLRQGGALPGAFYLRASEYDAVAYRPKLGVTYSVP